MSGSNGHITSMRYNRGMQNTPKKRLAYRDQVWLSYLKGRVRYGSTIKDLKSSTERKNIRRQLKAKIKMDRLHALLGVFAMLFLVWLLINWAF